MSHLPGDPVVIDPLAPIGIKMSHPLGHGSRNGIEIVPTGMLPVIVDVTLTMSHLPGDPVVIDPLAPIGGDVAHASGHGSVGVDPVPGI